MNNNSLKKQKKIIDKKQIKKTPNRKIKKVKIKWKNIFILITVLSLTIIFSVKAVKFITKSIKSNIEKKQTQEKDKKDKEIKQPTEEEIKLNKLNNIDKRLNYFNKEYLDRYINYKETHKDLSDEQIIKDVNMHLDKPHYEYTQDAEYKDTLDVLVNKYYSLEEDYEPENLETISSRYALSNMRLVKEAKEAFEKMSSDASKEKLKIIAMSTYRSYNYQKQLYNNYVREDGQEAADTYSGRPGFSEHQTGLAVDVYNEEERYTNFHKTKEYEWMQEHAQEYGFILRYPEEKEKETGYHYESWHYRYVGVETAKIIKEKNLSFEEYFITYIKPSKNS